MLSAQVALLTALAALSPVRAFGLQGIVPYMGTACEFIVFGSSAVTTGANGHYDGKFGISPNSIAAMTIPPGIQPVPLQDYWTAHPQVVDTVHGPGFAADQARIDMMNAYNYAWAQEPTGYENEFSPILSGQTFLPGVYRWSGSIALGASDTVTLVGTVDSVFIFQSTSVTTGAFSKVVLKGGLTAKSVYWVPSETLGLGAFSQFSGFMLTGSAANIGASSTVDGALMAQSAVNIGAGVVMTNESGLCLSIKTLTASGLSTKAKRAAKLAPRWDRDVVRTPDVSRRSHLSARSNVGRVQHAKRN